MSSTEGRYTNIVSTKEFISFDAFRGDNAIYRMVFYADGTYTSSGFGSTKYKVKWMFSPEGLLMYRHDGNSQQWSPFENACIKDVISQWILEQNVLMEDING